MNMRGMMRKNFTGKEKRHIAGISLILGLRMLGISLVVPIFSLYATGIPGASSSLAGIAAGVFGLMQTLFQVPLGRISDRWGRKRTAMTGLAVYAAGSVISGVSADIYQLIVGRIIAGAGAVSGVTMAWATEEIPAEKRSLALSYIGMAIGSSVIIGFPLSTQLADWISISAPFHICAIMILLTIVYIHYAMNDPAGGNPSAGGVTEPPGDFVKILRNGDLLRVNIAALMVNISLTAIFFAMPILISRNLGVGGMWKVLVPVAVTGTACMYFFSRKADRLGTVPVATGALLICIAGTALPVLLNDRYAFMLSLILFYSGFCILSPVLPAAISHHPSANMKGTIMSLFNSSQFVGSGIGGIAGGIMMEYDYRILFALLSVLLLTALLSLRGFSGFGSPGSAGGYPPLPSLHD